MDKNEPPSTMVEKRQESDDFIRELYDFVLQSRFKHEWEAVCKLEETADQSAANSLQQNLDLKTLLEKNRPYSFTTQYAMLTERKFVLCNEIDSESKKLQELEKSVKQEEELQKLECDEKIKVLEEEGKKALEEIKQKIENRQLAHVRKVETMNNELELALSVADLEEDELETNKLRELIDLNVKLSNQQKINNDLRKQIEEMKRNIHTFTSPLHKPPDDVSLLQMFHLENIEDIFNMVSPKNDQSRLHEPSSSIFIDTTEKNSIQTTPNKTVEMTSSYPNSQNEKIEQTNIAKLLGEGKSDVQQTKENICDGLKSRKVRENLIKETVTHHKHKTKTTQRNLKQSRRELNHLFPILPINETDTANGTLDLKEKNKNKAVKKRTLFNSNNLDYLDSLSDMNSQLSSD
ncbi:putative leucine-rich repeat-containing protein DDB_G0290503 [Euwallacea fornicatus]|uniref:putative leucine-rich repeat-containing protein DDB_G0290503 n=1 Tax=Euwallacea fornicatus TaxID=995702 RepID=UPI00338DFAB0